MQLSLHNSEDTTYHPILDLRSMLQEETQAELVMGKRAVLTVHFDSCTAEVDVCGSQPLNPPGSTL